LGKVPALEQPGPLGQARHTRLSEARARARQAAQLGSRRLAKSAVTFARRNAMSTSQPAPLQPNATTTDTLQTLAQQLQDFALERDWQQFHSPKNLAAALSVEAGELLEHFQWLTEEQSRALTPEKREAVGAELADVLLYLIQLASALGIDPVAAAQAKLQLNAVKYPVDRARGNSKKYDEL
jgi:NTP pyrophosphatase (non-canonical NTP hydrolase)